MFRCIQVEDLFTTPASAWRPAVNRSSSPSVPTIRSRDGLVLPLRGLTESPGKPCANGCNRPGLRRRVMVVWKAKIGRHGGRSSRHVRSAHRHFPREPTRTQCRRQLQPQTLQERRKSKPATRPRALATHHPRLPHHPLPDRHQCHRSCSGRLLALNSQPSVT